MFSNLCVGDRFKGRNEVMQRQERVHCAPPAAVSAYRLHSLTHTHTHHKSKSQHLFEICKMLLEKAKGEAFANIPPIWGFSNPRKSGVRRKGEVF